MVNSYWIRRMILILAIALLPWRALAEGTEAQPLNGKGVQVSAAVDHSSISIGDQVTLHLEVTGPPELSVVWPSFSDGIKDLEIVRQGKPATTKTDQGSKATMDLVLTAFEEGKFEIPAQKIGYSFKGSAAQILETKPISLAVRGIQVDTKKDIKDIKPPLKVGISFREMLPYIAALLGAALLAWLVIYVMKKRKRGEKILPQPPPRPAHEIALEALRLLEAEKLWQQGREKEYHSRISDILRTYIEATQGIPAMEMTTKLILSASCVEALNPEWKETLQQILERSDLVKFAKFRPVADEHKNSLDSAVWFVQRTFEYLHQPRAIEGLAEVRAE